MPIKKKKRKIVCICGSSRFCQEIAITKWEFEKLGKIALGLHLLPSWYMPVKHHGAEFEGVAETLDQVHFSKIDIADEIFIFNKNGYVGNQTAKEIKYAKKKKKKIVYLEEI